MPFRLASPRLRLYPLRLLDAPRVYVRADGEVRVSGMACPLCAARTRTALAAVPGIAGATVDLDSERAALRLAPGASRPPPVAAMQAALDRVVLGARARRWLERATRRARHEGA